MSSKIDNNKKKQSHQGSSTSSSPATATATNTAQTLNRKLVDNNNRREQEAIRTKRRPTKVGLNDTLRRIRYLIVEGRSNSEIQNILQLNERTFYRYMAKVYEIDQALFAEQEKKTLVTEAGIFKDRLLRSYRWFMAIADNENMKPEIRMQAQNTALQVVVAVLKSELEGPRVIRKQGSLETIGVNL
jgi:hypothetical protein